MAPPSPLFDIMEFLRSREKQAQRAGIDLPGTAGEKDFDVLSQFESQKRSELGKELGQDIEDFAGGFGERSGAFRDDLSQSLLDLGQQQFERATPGFLEDLNRRGLFTSESAVAGEGARVLGDISRENQSRLLDFDVNAFGREEDILGDALSARLGGKQSSTDALLGLQRDKISQRLGELSEGRRRAFEGKQAAKGRKADIIGGLIGGVGGLIGGLCFDPNTPIELENGENILIRDVGLGDIVRGGEVKSIRWSIVGDGERYKYKGMIITGSHAVKEDGKWLRVKDSEKSYPIDGGGTVVSIITTEHRIYSNGVELADEIEHDNGADMTLDQCLEELNKPEMVLAEA